MQSFLKRLFVPSKHNGYRPNFLERMSVGIMLVLILLTFSIANLQALLWIGSEWMVSTILPAVIVDLTNERREDSAHMTLVRSEVLDRAATLKAEDMAKNGYFAHYSPTGTSPWYWFDEVGYNYLHAGENLAIHFTDSGDVVRAWMNSPLHRANIMDEKYTEIGVGTAKGNYEGYPTVYVVQLFGTQNAEPYKDVVTYTETTREWKGGDVSDALNDIAVSSGEAPFAVVAPATIDVREKDSTEIASPMDNAEASEAKDSILARAEAPAEQRQLVDVVERIPPEIVILHSDFATASREGVPLTVSKNESVVGEGLPITIGRTATQPRIWLQIVYGMLALIVIIALVLSIVIEWKRQQPLQIVYACALLGVMGVLYHLHTALTSGVTIA